MSNSLSPLPESFAEGGAKRAHFLRATLFLSRQGLRGSLWNAGERALLPRTKATCLGEIKSFSQRVLEGSPRLSRENFEPAQAGHRGTNPGIMVSKHKQLCKALRLNLTAWCTRVHRPQLPKARRGGKAKSAPTNTRACNCIHGERGATINYKHLFL